MENPIFLQIEIFIFIITFLYVLYYLGVKIFHIFFKVRNIIKPIKIEDKKTALNKVKLVSNKLESNFKKKKSVKISEGDRKKVIGILKRIKMNSSKGYFDTSKHLIVEGLSLDKHNKELNIELASIYEKEKNYLNAEYIYKDLLHILKIDLEVMKKLGYVYALQNKLKDAFEIYEKIHNKKMADDEVIDFLSDIAFTMKDYKKTLKYTNLYLVSKPRDVNKLFIKAQSLEKIGEDLEAIASYKRILELQPYNTKAKESLTIVESLNV